MIAINLPRRTAVDWAYYIKPEEGCWISIIDPDLDHATNAFLDALPTLKLKFNDVINDKKFPVFKNNEWVWEKRQPPSPEDAKKIVDFLLKHKRKIVISNCYAGKCRSGAISKFCVDFLGYEWDQDSKNRADPNSLLYKLMKDYYLQTCIPFTKIIDKRGKR